MNFDQFVESLSVEDVLLLMRWGIHSLVINTPEIEKRARRIVAVGRVQRKLVRDGFLKDDGLTVDGQWGPRTDRAYMNAVKEYSFELEPEARAARDDMRVAAGYVERKPCVEDVIIERTPRVGHARSETKR